MSHVCFDTTEKMEINGTEEIGVVTPPMDCTSLTRIKKMAASDGIYSW